MPVNEFDQSVRPEYVSNRIELPFRELAGIAANQQKSFDEGRAIEDNLGLLGEAIKAAPMYEGHRQAFIKEYQSKIKELTGNGNINYADPEFKRKASMLVNEFKSRPEINAFANTLKSYQDWESQVKNPDNAMNLDFTYKKDKDGNFNQLDVNKQGVYSPTFTKFEDYNETGKKIMGHIAQDGSLKDLGYDFSKPENTRINNGETEVFNSKNHKWEGVTSDKLGKLSKIMAGEYANTTAGKHHLQSLIGENITYNQLDEDTRAKVDKIFTDHLYRANANQVGVKTEDKLDYHFETDRKAQKSNDDKYNDDSTPINPWNVLTGQGTPEEGALNNILASINSGFKFNSNGELEEKTSLESSYAKQNGKVSIYKDKATGQTWDINNLPKGWKLVTRPGELSDIIANDKGERINLTNKAYNNEFSHTYGNSSTKSYKPSTDYINQQREVLSFLKNSNQYDDKKTAQENYQSGIKLYGNAIKSGKLNSMSVPEFDAVTAKAFEDYYLPKFTENKDGELILKDAGRTSQWSIEGIDKGSEDGLQEFNNIVAGSNIVGPDLSKGGSHVLLNTRDGKMVSVNLNNQTLEANFKKLADFNKKNNEAIYIPNRANTAKDFSQATVTSGKQTSTLDDMQNQMLNLTQQYSPESIQEVGATLERDRHNIDNLSLNLKKNNYQPLNTYYDKESNTIGISFINRQDPNNPDIQVVHYQPGTEPTIVSNAVFNRDIYQKLFGKIAVNMSDKSSNFTGTQLNTQKAK